MASTATTRATATGTTATGTTATGTAGTLTARAGPGRLSRALAGALPGALAGAGRCRRGSILAGAFHALLAHAGLACLARTGALPRAWPVAVPAGGAGAGQDPYPFGDDVAAGIDPGLDDCRDDPDEARNRIGGGGET